MACPELETVGPDGAFFIGDPATVAAKCLRVSEQLGGVERINLQMTNPDCATPTCCTPSSCSAPGSSPSSRAEVTARMVLDAACTVPKPRRDGYDLQVRHPAGP